MDRTEDFNIQFELPTDAARYLATLRNIYDHFWFKNLHRNWIKDQKTPFVFMSEMINILLIDLNQ